jgi:feruloyl esterase
LPKTWNGKALMLGGGGFNGVIPNVTGNPLNAASEVRTPLARGYAVFGGDSGHQTAKPPGPGFDVGNVDGLFFLNDEVYRNYIGDALKKTRDAAFLVIKAAYRRDPARSYFLGGSKGGGEALAVAGRWPQDWDGIVALYPGRNYTATLLGMLHTTQAFAARGAYLSIAKRDALHRAALAACDMGDGVEDGIIGNVRRCRTLFDPASAKLGMAPLRCKGGADLGDNCLSDPQIAALRKVDKPVAFPFAVGRLSSTFPGFNILTSDLGASSKSPLGPAVAALTIGSTPPAYPLAAGNSLAAYFSDNFVKYAIARRPDYDQLKLDISKPGALAERLVYLSSLDQADTDLTAFARRGGKLLIMHGTDDMLISPRATQLYVKDLTRTMGARKVRSFLRYYEVPGFGHALSTTFTVSWDQLTALESWVERGVDPARNQIVTDTVGVPGRTRPLCLFPAWPRYKGGGDVNSATSFVCASR